MLAKFTTIARRQAIGLLALFVALGGTSYAVATGSIDSREIKNGSVRSKDLRNNDVRSGDVRDASLRAKDFKAGELPAGAQGPRGLPGQNATKLFAYVRDAGPEPSSTTVAYGSGVTAVTDGAAFSPYKVTFSRNVRGCVVHATSGLGQPNGENWLVVPSVPQVMGVSDNQFDITFFGTDGNQTDTSFMVSAFC